MGNLNSRVQKLKPSETLAVKAKVNELRAQGRKVIDLSIGEPDVDTPQHIKDAATKAMQEGKTKYTTVSGIDPLREALAEKLARDNGIKTDAASIIVTNGGKQALYEIFDVTLEPGDEVVIPAPYWVSYPVMIEMAGGVSVIVKTKPQNGFKMTPAELSAVMTPRTKCVILNSPSNPTGVGYTRDELAALGAVIEKSSALVVSDEVYEKLVFDHFKFCSVAQAMPSMANRIVTVNAFSKTYSMTGWRVGYATGPKDIISAMGRHQSQTTSNVNSVAQYAALAALKGPHDFVKQMCASFQRRIAMTLEILGAVPGVSVPAKPDGAFYLFVSFAELATRSGLPFKGSAACCNYLLEKAGVAAVPGEAFGDDLAIRLSVGASDEDVRNGVTAIANALR